MRELPQSLFDIYALSLPRGHAFGYCPPIGAWRSEDDLACGIITRADDDGSYGVLVMRRREDHVWLITHRQDRFTDMSNARRVMEHALKEGQPPERIPPGVVRRPALYDLEGRQPSDIFRLLTQPTHHVAAWLLHQVYLAFANPDRNWAADCQTDNFHTRLWEAQLLACFREQGLLVTQPFVSPDFRIENRSGGEAWVEAVTANPPVRYNHVNATPTDPPAEVRERVLGPAALRFAKTLGNKLQRRYDQLPHVAGKPYLIALADFHAPASMVWSREALIGYLYGMHVEVVEDGGRRKAVPIPATHLTEGNFAAGLFRNADHEELSGVVFTNACSIGKFNRVGVSAGALAKGLRYVRFGRFYDRRPGALKGIPFCLDITSSEYRRLLATAL